TACTITDEAGNQLDSFYLERRYPVEDITDPTFPRYVWQAFVAAEDRRFFEHPGVDALGILRAIMVNARAGRTVEGASTLTQQLVKNILLTNEKSLDRKIKEAVLAWRMERELTKMEILRLYMDFIYLGSGNYGVEAAAQDYFGKTARDLLPHEIATIAALIPAPSHYSPRTNPEEALRRRRLVLRAMVEEGFLDATEVSEKWNLEPLVLSPGRRGADRGAKTSYITVVRREIQKYYGSNATIDGLHIVTPYNAKVQEVAVRGTREAAEAHLKRQGPRPIKARSGRRPPFPDKDCFRVQVPENGDLGALRAGAMKYSLLNEDRGRRVFDEREDKRPSPLRSQIGGGEILAVCLADDAPAPAADEPPWVTIDDEPWAQSAAVVIHHPTGRVVAVTGGVGPGELEGFVRGVQAQRQPGSSFKPYVYASALELGKSQLDIMVDRPIRIGNWAPQNYGKNFRGPMPIRIALTRSTNTIAVQLMLEAGPQRVAKLAYNLGVRTPLRPDLTMALGTSEVTPLDQAVGYAGLARGGVPTDPIFVLRVEDAAGGVIAEAGEPAYPGGRRLPGGPKERVMSPGVAAETVDMLKSVVRFGTGRRAYRDDVDRAGKTGTTNNFVDGWFVGLTPEHAIAVWVGTDGYGTLGDKETGGKASLPAWIAIAETLMEFETETRFPIPDEVVLVPWQGQQVALRRGGVHNSVLPLPPLTKQPLASVDR
ncbi:MAG: PBP1A family penicillin-binding protein, partial [Myxococcota bacterium]